MLHCCSCFWFACTAREQEAPYADGCSQIEILQTLKEHGGSGLLPSGTADRARLSDAFVGFVADCLRVKPEVSFLIVCCRLVLLVMIVWNRTCFLSCFFCVCRLVVHGTIFRGRGPCLFPSFLVMALGCFGRAELVDRPILEARSQLCLFLFVRGL